MDGWRPRSVRDALHGLTAILTLAHAYLIPSTTSRACVVVIASGDDVPWLSFSHVVDSQQFHAFASLFCLPSGYPCGLAAAVATLLMTAGQPQELQRTLPGARRISFADESGVKLWARSQLDKARCGVCSGPRTKKPAGREPMRA